MGCTVEHYWQQHRESFETKSSVVASQAHIDLIDGDPKRGVIHARIYFHDEHIYLDVFEHVEITDRPHRRKYSYNLQMRGELVERFDYDPKLPPDISHHVNRPGGDHDPSERLSLSKVLSLCWGLIAELEALGDEPEH